MITNLPEYKIFSARRLLKEFLINWKKKRKKGTLYNFLQKL